MIGWPIFLCITFLAGLGVLLGAAVDRSGRLSAWALGWIWGRLLWIAEPFWWRRWRGLEQIGEGPYVVVANHQSVIDIPCLFGLPLLLRVSARPGIFRSWPMGPFLRWSKQVNTAQFLEEAEAALRAGFSVIVFPEGSRSPNGRVRRFRKGAFELALRAGVPLLPVAMDGAQHILSKHARMPTRLVVPVHARVLAPILPEGSATDLARRTRAVVEAELSRIREGR